MKSYLSTLRRLILTCILIFSFIFSFAETYYISPTGSDATGDGSFSRPWRTLYKATSMIRSAGNIIHANAGTYTETSQIDLAPGVSIEGDGVTSIIKSTLSENYQALLLASSVPGTNGNQHISNLKFDGQNLTTFWCIWVSGRNNVSIYNCTVVDFKDRGVIFNARNDFLDQKPLVYMTGNSFHDNIVHNSAAYNLPTGVFGRGCLNIGGQDGMQIYNNTITQTQRPEGFNGWPIKYVNDGYLNNCRIYNNTLTKIPYGGDFPGQSGWDFCIELFHIQGLEISGNTIQGSIDLNYNTKGPYAYCAWIHHNTMNRVISNNKYESGIIFEFDAETAIVEYNTFINISSGVQFNTRDRSIVIDCAIQKNLFAKLGMGEGVGTAGGILIISEGTNNPQVTNMAIYNNTITTEPSKKPFEGIDFSPLDNGGAATNVRIRNNIITGFGDAWLKGGVPTNMRDVVVTHNDAYNNGNNNQPSFPGGNPANYTYSNNISADPRFVNISANDYRLQAGSPCIDAGIYVGLPFLGSAPDMGYLEFNSGGPLPIILADFTAKDIGGKNLLQWTTGTESNSDHFDVQRSADGRNFYSIGHVNAGGFSTSEIKYSFTDITPLKNINYYRLVLVDKDASLEYSKIVSVSTGGNNGLGIISADISTTTNMATIRINSGQKQSADLSIIDVSGRTVLTSPIQLVEGNNLFTKNISNLLQGVYYIRLVTQQGTVVKNTLSRN